MVRAGRRRTLPGEIGELPLDAQVRFLRVLQDGFVERVGGRDGAGRCPRVAATATAAMVQDGRFASLWYRIAVFPSAAAPAIRGTTSLNGPFVQRAAVRFPPAAVELTPSDIELLRAYHWPGNIRGWGGRRPGRHLGDGERWSSPSR